MRCPSKRTHLAPGQTLQGPEKEVESNFLAGAIGPPPLYSVAPSGAIWLGSRARLGIRCHRASGNWRHEMASNQMFPFDCSMHTERDCDEAQQHARKVLLPSEKSRSSQSHVMLSLCSRISVIFSRRNSNLACCQSRAIPEVHNKG
jgi:hypothetical protein